MAKPAYALSRIFSPWAFRPPNQKWKLPPFPLTIFFLAPTVSSFSRRLPLGYQFMICRVSTTQQEWMAQWCFRPMSGQSTLVPCGIAWNVWGTICIKQTGSKDRVDSSGRQCKKGKKIEAVWVVEYSKNGTREQMEMSPFPPCVLFFFFFF